MFHLDILFTLKKKYLEKSVKLKLERFCKENKKAEKICSQF